MLLLDSCVAYFFWDVLLEAECNFFWILCSSFKCKHQMQKTEAFQNREELLLWHRDLKCILPSSRC